MGDTREMDERACWCGERDLAPYAPEYRACRACGTLVSRSGLTAAEVAVQDDDRDFYGKTYWLGHQTDELGLPDITRRARADLSERCLHWLRHLLPRKPPPARVLDVGCAHGGFVALLRSLGYDATGLELSPWVVDFARRTFGVPVLLGVLEQQRLSPGSLDAVVLNDVLEHLADPVGTVACCAGLLAEDGVLLVQTPCYPEGSSYEELCGRKDRFLEMMEGLARQHLYLFSRRAVDRLLQGAGFGAVEFLPAMFPYDMYLAAGRTAVAARDLEALAARLTASPAGRVPLAWMELLLRHEVCAFHCDARLDVIHRLDALLRESEAARAALRAGVERLRAPARTPVAPSRRWLHALLRLRWAG